MYIYDGVAHERLDFEGSYSARQVGSGTAFGTGCTLGFLAPNLGCEIEVVGIIVEIGVDGEMVFFSENDG